MKTVREAEPLLALAKSRDPVDRERLLTRLVELCEADADQGELATGVARQVEAVFLTLVSMAERDIRARLAERLAYVAWAPPALIETLARDDIEVARPIIAASPMLRDATLIELLTQATLAHQVAVAQRPRISAEVVDAILSGAEPDVLTALAANDTADVSDSALGKLVDHSKQISAMRAALIRHPRMSKDLAERLYMWVGQSLRSTIMETYPVDVVALDAVLAASVVEAHNNGQLAGHDPERAKSETQLVSKLAAAGQLRPSYLLRVLREQQLGLFEAAMARLGGFDIEEVRRATCSPERPELLALACASVGIDRSVFPTVLDLVRSANGGLPGGGPEGARRAISAFGPFAPDIAAIAFRRAIAAA